METATSRRSPLGGVLMIVGGALGAVGSFLTWADVQVADVSASAKGIDGSDGYITVVGGLLLVVAGILAMRTTGRRVAVFGIMAGLLVAGVGIYDAVTAEDSVLDATAEEVAPQVGVPVEQVRTILQQSADSGELDISLQLGLFLVIGGGVIGTIGGVIATATANRDAMAAEPTMPGAAPGTVTTPGTMGTARGTTETTATPPTGAPPPPPGTPAE